MQRPRQHIAIIGGNFAGLTAAIKLSKRHAVTVIDPTAFSQVEIVDCH